MNVDSMTIGEARQLAQMFQGPAAATAAPWRPGTAYLIRTVTMTVTGRLTEVHPHELVLEDAAWVADTGRFAAALSGGTLTDVEPFPDGPVFVGRGAVVDAAVWAHPLPRTVKP